MKYSLRVWSCGQQLALVLVGGGIATTANAAPPAPDPDATSTATSIEAQRQSMIAQSSQIADELVRLGDINNAQLLPPPFQGTKGLVMVRAVAYPKYRRTNGPRQASRPHKHSQFHRTRHKARMGEWYQICDEVIANMPVDGTLTPPWGARPELVRWFGVASLTGDCSSGKFDWLPLQEQVDGFNHFIVGYERPSADAFFGHAQRITEPASAKQRYLRQGNHAVYHWQREPIGDAELLAYGELCLSATTLSSLTHYGTKDAASALGASSDTAAIVAFGASTLVDAAHGSDRAANLKNFIRLAPPALIRAARGASAASMAGQFAYCMAYHAAPHLLP